ncbi:TonB-dependent receptor [bacterium]|nr:TonB-dependent receptor [bacterium]NUN44735.1 TonB-dependent receptor [bacterium]
MKNRLPRFPLYLAAVLFFVIPTFLQAQVVGKITGTIVDASNGDPLIGANVFVLGTKLGGITDLDGNFIIGKIPVGTYSIEISCLSYKKKTVHNLTVNDGLASTLKISLEPEALEGEEVVVEAEVLKTQESGLLLAQKKSSKVMDGVSSEQIAKTSDGNAGAALKRVTGVTIVGDKDVYVRGLGNRYSNVQLNGSVLPSTNPNQKETPLNIFSSNVIDNIIVQKTYTPDQPGEFSGGSVQIETKDFPESRTIKIGVSSMFNSNSLGNDYLNYNGGGSDFLGFDDGTRKLPTAAKQGRIGTSQGVTAIRQFQNSWSPRSSRVAPGQSYSISYGDQVAVGSRALGFIAAINYSYQNQVRNEVLRNLQQAQSLASDYDASRGMTSTLLSGMLNVSYKINPTSKVSLRNLYTNVSDNTASRVEGYYYNSGGDYRQTQLRFSQRSIFASNLQYDTYIKEWMDSKILIEATMAAANAYEPDTRNTHYAYNSTLNQYEIVLDQRTNTHFFSDQKDRDYNVKLNWDLKLLPTLRLKTGGLFYDKQRDFEARRFAIAGDPQSVYPAELKTTNPEEALNPDLFSNGGLIFFETTRNTDSYKGDQNIFAGYLSADLTLGNRWNLIAGARAEHSIQRIDKNEVLNTADILPAINLTFKVSDRANLRAAFSTTLARPEFRELSNFFYSDFVGARTVYGNPDLKRTKIQNYDLRWETYPGIGEYFAVSGFYKHFTNPIEIFHRLSTNPEVYYGNIAEADLWGIELEARKALTEALRVTANLALMTSSVNYGKAVFSQANRNRPMYGQSPYTINLNGFYVLRSATEFSLAYNRFGKRLSSVGNVSQGEDEYEMPFDKLDFTATQKFGKWTYKLSMQNLLNDRVINRQGDTITRKYAPGITYSVGASYDF